MISVFHCKENCEGKIVKTRPYQFMCNDCDKRVHVMDSSSLNEEDMKIFEELMKNE